MRSRIVSLCAVAALLAGCSLPDPQVHVAAENGAGHPVQAHVVARFDRKGGASSQVLEWNGTLAPGAMELGTFQRPCQDGRVGTVTYNATVDGRSAERAQAWEPGGCPQQHILLRIAANLTWEFTFG